MSDPRKILVINAGSSSIKYRLYLMPGSSLLAKGALERIGEEEASIHHEEFTDEKACSHTERLPIPNHKQGLKRIMDLLGDPSLGILHDLNEIFAVGHRVVHGGESFVESVLIDERVMKAIESHSVLAPLHNPANLSGIRASQEVLPDACQVAAFDTAFHHTLPEYAYRYAVPEGLYKKHGLRRYGFHGTSHRYVARRTVQHIGISKEDANLITAHLGNGCSVTAVRGGLSIDTSMGFTPLEGLVMGTRCGDVDPAVPLFMVSQLGMSPAEVDRVLNKESGLLALSGRSNDMREILKGKADGDRCCELALEVFSYRVKKYIGAYKAILGPLDALVFTGGIGEHSSQVRAMICRGLDAMGMVLDDRRNKLDNGLDREVSRDGSPTRIWVIPTNEEVRIAVDTYEVAHQWRRTEG